MTFQLSAGVYPFEIDKSSFISPAATSIAAVVAGLNKGPLGPTLVTSEEKFLELYGYTPASFSKAPYCIRAALKQVTSLYVNRVINGALYAGTSFFNDKLNNATIGASFPTGSKNDFESGSRSLQLVSIDSPLVESNELTVDIDNGEGEVSTITQSFSNTSNETLAALAIKITSELASFGTGGEAVVVDAYNGSDKNMQIAIKVSGILTATNCTDISGKISIMGAEPKPFTAPFTTDNDNTLQALASAISAIDGVTAQVKPGATAGTASTVLVNCDTAGPDSIAVSDLIVNGDSTITILSEITKEGHGVYDDRTIQVILPENSQASIKAIDITGGASQPTAKIESNVKILDVFAENPGDWGNEYGVKLSGLDYGIASRYSITFATALVKDNVFSCDIVYQGNRYAINVPFASTSDATLKAIAQAITDTIHPLGLNRDDFGYAFVDEVVGGSDNDRVINVVSPTSMDDIEILNAVVTDGDTQTTVVVAKVLDAEESSNTFTLSVYEKTNVNAPVETFTCSFKEQVDGNGTQQYIEEVVNKGSGASKYIRVKVNNLANLQLLGDTNISWLNGGDNGAVPTNAQIIQGWDDFSDPEKITIRLMINAGYTNIAVQQKMVAIAQKRHDCFAILDMPSDQQSAEAAVNYRKFKLNINSSYGAIYSNDLLITDNETGMQLYVPPSGHVCAQFAYTDMVRAEWWAPAGLNRGLVQEVQGIRYKYDEGERDLLSTNQVNYIREMPGKGYPIWEENTLQSKSSALSNIHVRRLLISLEVAITDYLEDYVFDPNDETTRSEISLVIEDYLMGLQRGRAFNVINGENGYMVKCDEDNNPAYLLDQGVMVVDVYIKPISIARFIKLNVVIAKASASFSELVAQAA